MSFMEVIAFFLLVWLLYVFLPSNEIIKSILLAMLMISGWLAIFEFVSLIESNPILLGVILPLIALLAWQWTKRRRND